MPRYYDIFGGPIYDECNDALMLRLNELDKELCDVKPKINLTQCDEISKWFICECAFIFFNTEKESFCPVCKKPVPTRLGEVFCLYCEEIWDTNVSTNCPKCKQCLPKRRLGNSRVTRLKFLFLIHRTIELTKEYYKEKLDENTNWICK